MDFLKWDGLTDGLTDVGDIPYRFVHFEQDLLQDMAYICQMAANSRPL